MVLTSLLSLVPSSSGAPVELLRNGDLKKGLEGWTVEGLAFLYGESVKILLAGSLSQSVQRPDLSFHLELSYGVRTELPSKMYFARSLVTFYMVDRESKDTRHTIVGQAHEMLGDSGWRDVKLDLLQLFRKDVGDPGNFQLKALKVTVELGFITYPSSPGAAYFRNISLRRANPVRILLHEGGCKELPDRAELAVSITNVGDMNASNLVVTLILSPELMVVSGQTTFVRPTLEGGSSWRLGWMLAARSPGVHPVTIRASSDQARAELSLSVPVAGTPRITTTQTVTVTKEQAAEQVIMAFVQTVLLVMVALIVVAMVVPLYRGRAGSEVVYRLRLVRNQSAQPTFA